MYVGKIKLTKSLIWLKKYIYLGINDTEQIEIR